MTGLQNESEMYISVIIIKEISNLERLIILIVGARRWRGLLHEPVADRPTIS